MASTCTIDVTFTTIVPLVKRPSGSYLMVNAVDPFAAVIVTRCKNGHARSRWFKLKTVGENP